MFGRGHWDRDVRRAMRGVLGVQVHFSRHTAAQGLWDYGEDALAERALTLTDKELAAVQRIAAVYEDTAYPLPVQGTRITHRHVNALAVVAYVGAASGPWPGPAVDPRRTGRPTWLRRLREDARCGCAE